jgi:CBS domain-containing protein
MPGRAIREIMTANPVVLMADMPVREAARKMRERDIGDVIVQKDGRLLGIVTDRDIVVRAIAENKDPSKTPLESICSKEVAAVSPEDSDDKAVRLMREKAIRRVPVVEGQRVVGIVSLGDLAVEKDPNSALGEISAAEPNT